MINANELRIGNFILWNPKLTNPITTLVPLPIEVSAIFQNKIIYVSPSSEYRVEPFEDDLLQKDIAYKKIEELEPIPLTPEILKKSGFVTADYKIDVIAWGYKDKFLISQNGVSVAEQPIIFEWDNGVHDTATEIRHLHQLQNLYFFLTGEELEIHF